jgi:hypothetical protein
MTTRFQVCTWMAAVGLIFASTRVWPRPNGREVVELILRDGPQAIRAESEVTRREQLARLAYPEPVNHL